MPTYTDLRHLGNKLVEKANEWHIPFQLLQYSAEIGCFINVHQFNRMNMQTKYVMLFKGDAFDDMQVVIDAFSPLEKNSLTNNKDSRQKNRYGRDVYQDVKQFTLYQELASSPDDYDVPKMINDGERWLKAQKKAFKDHEELSESELEQKMETIKGHFLAVLNYLDAQANSTKTIKIKRNSGTAHKLKLKPNTGSKKISFCNVLILFGEGDKFPEQVAPQKSKGGGNPSISAQYQANPSSFKYYDKFGIFEVYDK